MQVLVVGAGVVGLAVARAAALAGHDVTIAEVTGGIANGVSSRNSEVIHAGLYYPTDTLRAKLCVRGRRMLYDFCASHGVGHRKCGKLVVATNEAELAKVETIMAQAIGNGVEGVEMIGAKSGLGYMIWTAWETFSVEQMYVGLFMIAIIGFVLTVALNEIERLVVPWKRD